MRSRITVLSALLWLAAPLHAFNSGASFLKIDTDARAVSMGSAYTALASGVNSIGYNPAGLSAARSVELGFSHTNWIMESSHDFAGVAVPLKTPGLVLGLGITRLSNGSIDARGEDRSAGGSFSSYDQAISLTSAKSLGRNRLGLAVKYLESSIAGVKARGVAFDLGFNRSINTRIPMSLGLAVQNLGSGMKYFTQRDPLPLSVSAGFSFSVVPGLNLALDAKRMIYDKQNSVSLGTEYAVLSGLALRSGYLANTSMNAVKNKGFSVGMGLNFWNTSLDYSATPYGELGNTQKITLKRTF